jgi:hypothetical protein
VALAVPHLAHIQAAELAVREMAIVLLERAALEVTLETVALVVTLVMAEQGLVALAAAVALVTVMDRRAVA